MDKASRAIRRSGVKLLSMGGGHSALNVLVCDIKDVKNSAKTFMNAQHLAAQDMMKWASQEENRAVKDVVSNIADLYLLWSEVQNTFLSHLKDYRQLFEMILEGEKQVTQAKDNLEYCVEKEAKVRKEMKKCAKRASAGELRILQARVEQAEQAKDLAQVELSDRVRENEAIKLIRMKEGLLKMSGAYVAMSCQCNTIFTAQRNIALQLPDVHGRELESIKYSGAETTRFIVEKTRTKLELFSPSDVSSDPPPPYTPPDAATRGRSSSVSGIAEPMRQLSTGPRYSLNANTPLTTSGSRTSLENDLQRSRSNSNRSDTNISADVSTPHRTSSNSSLSNRGTCDTSAPPEYSSSQFYSTNTGTSDMTNVHTVTNQGDTATNSPVETLVHTNIVRIRQVTTETSPSAAGDGTDVKSCPGDGNLGLNTGQHDGIREPSEHSCNHGNVDNIPFVDDEGTNNMGMGDNLRPRPAPRRKSSPADYNDDYDILQRKNREVTLDNFEQCYLFILELPPFL